MGNRQSTPPALMQCLDGICNGRSDCVGYPGQDSYHADFVKLYDWNKRVEPIAIIRPTDADEVAAAVRCAAQHDVHVQARSGGHSYGNHGLGGRSGALCVDLALLSNFSMDTTTWQATFGPGLRVGQLSQLLHTHGGRAMAHGTSRADGIGGQAVLGGLGPMSRMWGTTLDHILEVEVVTASGEVKRASEKENAGLFWALRGAGPSFGIVTRFTARTHPEPPSVIEYGYRFIVAREADLNATFLDWQEMVADAKLDRRFSTLFIIDHAEVTLTATFYGTRAEFEASGIPGRIPAGGAFSYRKLDWLGHLEHAAETVASIRPDAPAYFRGRSLAFREADLLGREGIQPLMWFLSHKRNGPRAAKAAVVFSSDGGAIGDTAVNATAYPHRDKVMMYHAHLVDHGGISLFDRLWLGNIAHHIRAAAAHAQATYAGFVDRRMGRAKAQARYWGPHVAQLEQLKRQWDPSDVFHNPQSIDPAKE